MLQLEYFRSGIKKAVLSITFLLFAAFIYVHLSYLFRNVSWSRYIITQFYEEPRDSIDVVFVGGSNVFRYYNPKQAFEQEGFTSYDYAVEHTVPIVSDAIIDIQRTQDPILIVADVRCYLSSCFSGAMGVGFKNQLGSQDFHLMSRLETSLKHKFLGGGGYSEMVSIFLDLPLYHDNMEALSDRQHWLFMDDNRGEMETSDYKHENGYLQYLSASHLRKMFSNETKSLLDNDNTTPLEPAAERLYRDFLAWCQEKNVNILLVEAPFVVSEQDVLESNELEKIAKEYGIPFLGMRSIIEETGLNYERDYADPVHVNYLGAEKYTAFMAEYIEKNYIGREK